MDDAVSETREAVIKLDRRFWQYIDTKRLDALLKEQDKSLPIRVVKWRADDLPETDVDPPGEPQVQLSVEARVMRGADNDVLELAVGECVMLARRDD
jgi:hypothetical protein